MRQTDIRCQTSDGHHCLMPLPRGGGIIVIADGMLHTSGIVNSAGNSAQFFVLKMIVITTRHQNNDDMCMMSYSCIAKLCNGGYNTRFLHRSFVNL